MTDAIDDLLAELSELLARMYRLRTMGVRPVQVRQAVLDVVEEIAELEEEENG